MTLELDKNDLVNLVYGTSPSIEECDENERRGWMCYCGNQHNPEWKWNKTKLNEFSESDLWWLYNRYK